MTQIFHVCAQCGTEVVQSLEKNRVYTFYDFENVLCNACADKMMEAAEAQYAQDIFDYEEIKEEEEYLVNINYSGSIM